MSENLPAHSKVLLFLYSVNLNFSPFSLVLLSPVLQWEKIHCPKGSSFLFFFFFLNPQSLSESRNKVDFFFNIVIWWLCTVEIFSLPQRFPPCLLSFSFVLVAFPFSRCFQRSVRSSEKALQQRPQPRLLSAGSRETTWWWVREWSSKTDDKAQAKQFAVYKPEKNTFQVEKSGKHKVREFLTQNGWPNSFVKLTTGLVSMFALQHVQCHLIVYGMQMNII